MTDPAAIITEIDGSQEIAGSPRPSRPALIDVHDSTGGSTVDGSESAMPLDAVRVNGDIDNYSLAANAVTVQRPGTYLAGIPIAGAVRASSAYAMEGWIRVNSAEVALTRSRVRIGAT